MAKQDEIDLFKKYRQTGDPRYFNALYDSMRPLLNTAARKAAYGSNIPESAHKAWAAQSFFDALRTFDPSRGAALATHVHNAVHQKAKRLNYIYQNLGSIPEPRSGKIGMFQNELETFRAQYGRDPSTAELADRTGMSMRDVVSIQKEVKKDLSMMGGLDESGFFDSPEEDETLDLLYYDLDHEAQLVLEYIRGMHGKPRMVKRNQKIDYAAIGAKCGFSESKVRTIVARIKQKLELHLKR